MFNLKKNKKGFTLVELMVVVIIIGILTAIAIPVYNSVTNNAKIKASLANQRSIDSAIQVYFANKNEYPAYADLFPTYIEEQPVDPFEADYDIGHISVVVGQDKDGKDITEEAAVCMVKPKSGVNFPDEAKLHKDAK